MFHYNDQKHLHLQKNITLKGRLKIYRVAKTKRHHFTFLLESNFVIFFWFFGTYINFIRQQMNEAVLTAQLYVNSCSPEGATKLSSFYRAMHFLVQSAVLRSHVVCPSVRPSVRPSVCNVGEL